MTLRSVDRAGDPMQRASAGPLFTPPAPAFEPPRGALRPSREAEVYQLTETGRQGDKETRGQGDGETGDGTC